MHRFFVPKEQIPLLTGQDAHHLKNVLRAKVGDQVELLDGNGTLYACRVMYSDRGRALSDSRV